MPVTKEDAIGVVLAHAAETFAEIYGEPFSDEWATAWAIEFERVAAVENKARKIFRDFGRLSAAHMIEEAWRFVRDNNASGYCPSPGLCALYSWFLDHDVFVYPELMTPEERTRRDAATAQALVGRSLPLPLLDAPRGGTSGRRRTAPLKQDRRFDRTAIADVTNRAQFCVWAFQDGYTKMPLYGPLAESPAGDEPIAWGRPEPRYVMLQTMDLANLFALIFPDRVSPSDIALELGTPSHLLDNVRRMMADAEDVAGIEQTRWDRRWRDPLVPPKVAAGARSEYLAGLRRRTTTGTLRVPWPQRPRDKSPR